MRRKMVVAGPPPRWGCLPLPAGPEAARSASAGTADPAAVAAEAGPAGSAASAARRLRRVRGVVHLTRRASPFSSGVIRVRAVAVVGADDGGEQLHRDASEPGGLLRRHPFAPYGLRQGNCDV